MTTTKMFAQMMMAFVLLGGCSGVDEAVFREEVKLHDGRMVWLDRKARRGAFGFPERRGQLLDSEFDYEPLHVHWQGAAKLQPQSFEIFDGVPYAALSSGGEMEKCSNKYPDDFAMKYLKWQNGRWLEIPWREFPAEQALQNLVWPWGRDRGDDLRGVISWEEKILRAGFYPDVTIATSVRQLRHGLCGDAPPARD